MLHKQGGPNLQLELNACEGQYQKIPINSECFLIGALLHYNYMPYLFKQNSTTVRELLVNQSYVITTRQFEAPPIPLVWMVKASSFNKENWENFKLAVFQP